MNTKDNSKFIVAHQEFKKANEIISPRVARGGTLTLLSRKVFNVLLYHTQRLGTPGKDAPEGDPLYAELFWLPMKELAADAAYNSEDSSVIKDALQRLQDIKIVTDTAKSGFASDVLIPSIRVVPSRRGKPTMIGWKLDAATERILMSPDFYTRLSIYFLTSLKTTASIALYEIAKRYSTNPSGLTARDNWEWWHDVLTGLPVTNERTEYKYFKRDVLKPAIDEVNTTDISVELIEHKSGRRVVQLQFIVSKSAQERLELPVPPIIDSKLIERIRALGIHAKEAEDLYVGSDENLVNRTLDWIESRILNKDLPPVDSAAAMFRSALRGRYVDTAPAEKPIVRSLPKLKDAPADDPAIKARVESELAAFDAMTDEDKDSVWNSFIESTGARTIKRTGAIGRKMLGAWLAKQ